MLNDINITDKSNGTVEEVLGNNEESKANTDEYSIYNHLKSHPTSAFACFSAIVAIVTFFAQVMAYITNKNTLEYWGYSHSYASLGTDNLFYFAIASLVYNIVFAFFTRWFLKTTDVYIERKRYNLMVKYLLKKNLKSEKENLKTVKILEKTKTNDSTELIRIKEKIINTRNEINDLSKSARKDKFLMLLVFLKNLIPIIFLSATLAFLISLLNAKNVELWISVVYIFLVQLLSFLLAYFVEHRMLLQKKSIKKSANTLEVKDALSLVKSKSAYPIKYLHNSKSNGIRNSTFLISIAHIIVSCTVLVISFGFFAREIESKKKTFEIVNLDGQEYVVVYHNKDSYFLEKSKTTDDELYVYTKHQRILNTSDISFSVRTFNSVIKNDCEDLQ